MNINISIKAYQRHQVVGSAIVISTANGSQGASWEYDGVDDDFLRHLEADFQNRTDARLQG